MDKNILEFFRMKPKPGHGGPAPVVPGFSGMTPTKTPVKLPTGQMGGPRSRIPTSDIPLLEGIGEVNRRLGDILGKHHLESVATSDVMKTQNAVLEAENTRLLEMTEGLKQQISRDANAEKIGALDRQEMFDQCAADLLRHGRPMVSEQIQKLYQEIRGLQEALRKSEIHLKEVQLECEVKEKTLTNGFIDSMPEFNLTLDDIHRAELSSASTDLWAKQKTLEEKIAQIERSIADKVVELEAERLARSRTEQERLEKAAGFQAEEARAAERRQMLAEKKRREAWDRRRKAMLDAMDAERERLTKIEHETEKAAAEEEISKVRARTAEENRLRILEEEGEAISSRCRALERANHTLRTGIEELERESTDLQQVHIRKINEAFKNNIEENRSSGFGSAFSFADRTDDQIRANDNRIADLQEQASRVTQEVRAEGSGVFGNLKVQLVDQMAHLTDLRLRGTN